MFSISRLFKHVICVIVTVSVLYCISCVEDKIFEPTLEDRLQFFPLNSEYEPEYSFIFNSRGSYGAWGHRTRAMKGTFRLETEQTDDVNNFLAYRIVATFHIDEEEYTYKDVDVDEEYKRYDFNNIIEYNVLFENDTLWYVNDSLESSGSRSLMMAPPVAGGGRVNLKLFDYPGNFIFPNFSDNFLSRYFDYEIKGDMCVYHFRGGDEDYTYIDYNIIFVRNKGVVELLMKENQSSHASQQWNHSAHFKLLE